MGFLKNEKLNSKIKLSNNSSFVILIFAILKFRNIGRSKFWPPPKKSLNFFKLLLIFGIFTPSGLKIQLFREINSEISFWTIWLYETRPNAENLDKISERIETFFRQEKIQLFVIFVIEDRNPKVTRRYLAKYFMVKCQKWKLVADVVRSCREVGSWLRASRNRLVAFCTAERDAAARSRSTLGRFFHVNCHTWYFSRWQLTNF